MQRRLDHWFCCAAADTPAPVVRALLADLAACVTEFDALTTAVEERSVNLVPIAPLLSIGALVQERTDSERPAPAAAPRRPR